MVHNCVFTCYLPDGSYTNLVLVDVDKLPHSRQRGHK